MRLASYPRPELSDDVVRLRKWRMTDLECIRLASTDARIPKCTSVPAEFTEQAAQAFIARQWGRFDNDEGISLAVALADTDEAVGLVTLLQHPKYDSTYEIGYWLIPDARGKRLAARAVEQAARWAISVPSIKRVEAHVDTENVASAKTLLAAGFHREGVLRRYLKVGETVSDAAVFSIID